ncbi:MAG: 2-hydroxyacid dehydrogenase [Actinomycetota bacterium]
MSEARPKLLVTRELVPSVMEALRGRFDVDVYDGDGAIAREDLLKRIQGADAALTLLTEKVDAEFFDSAGPQLRIVANHAVGFDNVDVAAATRRGVPVSNTPEVLTETTADLAWSLLLAAARRIAEGDRFLRSRTPWIWGPQMMMGVDIHGKTLGVVGFGRIGQAVARRASGFNMKVIYSSSSGPREIEGIEAEHRDFDELLTEADFVSVNVALNDSTRHLFGDEEFRAMKPTAVLVNTARGPVVDEAALARALKAGEIFAAGIDVFEKEPEVHPELLECENAVIIPHLGSATIDTREAMGMLAAENLFAVFDGEEPPTLINPEVRKV